jgi:uncharacterized protein (TIGR00251 family)
MLLHVRVAPRSSKNEIVKMPDGTLKIKLHAPPVEGAANEELIKLLSEEYNTPKSSIKIIKGAKGKNKIVSLRAK